MLSTGWGWILAALTASVTCVLIWKRITGAGQHRFERLLHSRPDHSESWQAAFPNEMPIVERILKNFCEAFMLNDNYRFKLEPSDVIASIYRATTGPVADDMQLESFIISLENTFQIDLTGHWDANATLENVVRTILNKTLQSR